MFRRDSWLRRTGVSFLALAALALGSAGVPHLDGADEFACAPLPVAHDASAHYIGGRDAPGHAQEGHCFLCHSLRTFYPALEIAGPHVESPRAEPLHASTASAARTQHWTLVPGRAPPA